MVRLGRRALIALAGATPALLLGAGAFAAQRYLFPLPLDILADSSPRPVMADGRLRLLYELRVTNFAVETTGFRSLGLTWLEVTADGGPLAAFDADALKALILPIGPLEGSLAQREVLAPGRSALVLLDLVLPPAAPAPRWLSHRLTVADPAGGEALTVPGPNVAVASQPAPLIRPPLKGSGWVAGFALSNPNHRRAVSITGGRSWFASRFAIDWVRLGPDGRMFQGDPAQNASYYGYGSETVAVADGLVVEARDHAPDNLGNQRSPRPLDLDAVAGNAVLLKLGPSRYAVYDHLKQGSVRVRAGDSVKAGQVLAQVGNSGNTIAPHMHFQLMDSPVHNGADGLPYQYRAFTDLGTAPAVPALLAGDAWRPTATPILRRGEFPLDGAVVRFDGG